MTTSLRRFALSASLAVLALAGTAPTMAQDTAVYRIATEGGFSHGDFTGSSGELAGFEIELTQDLCKRMKRECSVVAQEWDGIIPGLNAGK